MDQIITFKNPKLGPDNNFTAYIYIYMCVCVCVCARQRVAFQVIILKGFLFLVICDVFGCFGEVERGKQKNKNKTGENTEKK